MELEPRSTSHILDGNRHLMSHTLRAIRTLGASSLPTKSQGISSNTTWPKFVPSALSWRLRVLVEKERLRNSKEGLGQAWISISQYGKD